MTSRGEIIFPLYDFTIGTHNVTIVVTDIANNSASDSVLIIVGPMITTSGTMPTSPTSTPTPPSGFGEMMAIAILTAGAIVVVIIVLVVKQRK